jgi:hypothetical protein
MTEPRKIPDWLVALLLIEATAVLIGLVTPITPSKTGTKRDLAELFFADPNYLQQALIDFIFVNILIGVIALAIWIYVLWDRWRRKNRGTH